jgi:hypothetical protein
MCVAQSLGRQMGGAEIYPHGQIPVFMAAANE